MAAVHKNVTARSGDPLDETRHHVHALVDQLIPLENVLG
jgi:hypothetical protein